MAAGLSAALAQRIADVSRETGLSPREQKVLNLLVLGRDATEIGIALHIVPRTVPFHRENALAKIGAESPRDIMRALIAGEPAAPAEVA